MAFSAFSDSLVELFESGASLIIATRDRHLRPEVARACGALVERDQKRVTVFLASSMADRTLANLADNGRIAVSFTAVFSHRSIQTKGKAVSWDLAAEIHQPVIQRYLSAWAETLYQTGIPRAITLQSASWPAVALVVDVDDVFVQTPGPNAGVVWTTGVER